ncbi:biotin--[acetyl-CoA-carboxylase] ligase [Brucella gallinifaecis]|uniref:biotin--[biotin carboxyl-carrier protein] ligase n=1 Tax=Brucella gallinifaecis TaxID=215590 RepID=A0A502BMI9_9HYPH|nr:biotin--[acetyl-CoA-carboxylase] ligase [Brucella gallinifaecis]TPF75120.1 biotin--[acetyl-CoA-carboxylase] ligase [Brucella gallinifaecis]
MNKAEGDGNRFTLAPAALADNYRLEFFPVVGSTNAEALERANAGDTGRLWFVSPKQESGRGRRGRTWTAPEGNLAATLLLVDHFEPQIAATLGFVAGLALADAVDAVLPQTIAAKVNISLKWPNDVLVDGAKLSGILLESTLLPEGRFGIAVGMGTNVVAAPQGLPYAATSINELGANTDAATLFLALSDAWCHYHRIWNQGRGLNTIRELWLKRAHGLGQPVAMRLNGRIVEGVFETIDSDCHLVIREDDGTRVPVTAGDVYFGTAASVKAGS